MSRASHSKTCREDVHVLCSNHGEIKWLDFVRGAKEGVILFKEKAKEALGKAKDANNGSQPTIKEQRSDVGNTGRRGGERSSEKKIIDQQGSLNKWKSKGRRFKGKGKGKKAAQPGSAEGKVQSRGKKTDFDSDEERDENGAAGPVKRAGEETDKEEPASKQQKTENGAGDQ
ncbi:Lupus La protein [Heterocephalus glaber]|uniref:Lupus La protein n=1 Tax=Heterocephalus glaber TaxID=10181 RepID=G5BZH0_HETGA|nr:Lupus La protein [Heterocephalus glaber]